MKYIVIGAGGVYYGTFNNAKLAAEWASTNLAMAWSLAPLHPPT